ncbi:MAG: sigma-54-dependent Fis family transcriptional regulator, partial [Desulfocapsa sp.]|nr:sigma-54-dependent Fis family transcriptional regulator [Desulfocapsa sp.]
IEGPLSGSVQASNPQSDSITPYKEAKDACLDVFTRQYIHVLLTKSHGNVSQAARMSDLTRAALQKIMRRYDINGNKFR